MLDPRPYDFVTSEDKGMGERIGGGCLKHVVRSLRVTLEQRRGEMHSYVHALYADTRAALWVKSLERRRLTGGQPGEG